MNSTGHGNPSKAYTVVIGKPGNGSHYWLYRDEEGEYRRDDALRQGVPRSGEPEAEADGQRRNEGLGATGDRMKM